MVQKARNYFSKKQKRLVAFVLIGILVLFFGGVSRGSAQDSTPTAEITAAATETQNTPAETPTVFETGTATPVDSDAQGLSSEVTQEIGRAHV